MSYMPETLHHGNTLDVTGQRRTFSSGRANGTPRNHHISWCGARHVRRFCQTNSSRYRTGRPIDRCVYFRSRRRPTHRWFFSRVRHLRERFRRFTTALHPDGHRRPHPADLAVAAHLVERQPGAGSGTASRGRSHRTRPCRPACSECEKRRVHRTSGTGIAGSIGNRRTNCSGGSNTRTSTVCRTSACRNGEPLCCSSSNRGCSHN